MAYKDKALQRETTKNRVRRYRSNQKALRPSAGALHKGVTDDTLQSKPGPVKDESNTTAPPVVQPIDAVSSSISREGKASSTVQPDLPVMTQYNYHRFNPGEKVLVQRGKRMVETVIPELDGDGNPIYEEG